MNRLLGAGCYSGTALSSMTERLSTDALLSFGHKYDFPRQGSKIRRVKVTPRRIVVGLFQKTGIAPSSCQDPRTIVSKWTA